MDKQSVDETAEMSAEVQLMKESYRRMQRQDFKQARTHEAFLEDTRKILLQQEQELEHLRREAGELQLVLGKQQEGGRLNTLALMQQFDASNAIRHRYEPLVENVAELQERKLALEKDIAAVKADIKQTTLSTSGEHVAYENATNNAQRVARLERKVLQVRGAFSKQLGVNDNLRRHISELRSERSRFVSLRQRLVDKILACREEQKKVLNIGTAAYREREFYETKLAEQTKSHDVFMMKYEKQRRLKACQIDETSKLIEFMNIKNRTREIYHEPKSKDAPTSDPADNADRLEKGVAKILAEAGLGDVEHLLDMFIKMEVERLSYCKHDVTLANDLQRLSAEKQILIFRCERLSDEEISLTNEQRAMINDLEHQSVALQHDTDKVTGSLQVITQDLDTVIERATHWVSLLSCDVSLLGENKGPELDIDTLIPGLGLVEKTALEAMNSYVYIQHKRSKGQSPISKKERKKSKARSMYTLPVPGPLPNTRSGSNLRKMPSVRSINAAQSLQAPPAWATSHQAVTLIKDQFTPEELRQAHYKSLHAPPFPG